MIFLQSQKVYKPVEKVNYKTFRISFPKSSSQFSSLSLSYFHGSQKTRFYIKNISARTKRIEILTLREGQKPQLVLSFLDKATKLHPENKVHFFHLCLMCELFIRKKSTTLKKMVFCFPLKS